MPLSETTDFLTDQVRSLMALLRTLRSLSTHPKQGNAEDTRKLYLEQLVAKKMADAGIFDTSTENWKEQKEQYDKIGSLEDIRNLDGTN
jgi:hypothetical protein